MHRYLETRLIFPAHMSSDLCWFCSTSTEMSVGPGYKKLTMASCDYVFWCLENHNSTKWINLTDK